ncbi:hypothetical protein [Actinoplanes sp. URMC 104]|uniref:hypothetical protein n=1 Tax=Actinoplanes sp. URMC 104 TaxID=3423409 RepID=UPI003F1D568B
MPSFGDGTGPKKKHKPADGDDLDGFEVLGGSVVLQLAVDPSRLEAVYEQVRAATRQGVLDGYAEAIALINAPGDGDEPVDEHGALVEPPPAAPEQL